MLIVTVCGGYNSGSGVWSRLAMGQAYGVEVGIVGTKSSQIMLCHDQCLLIMSWALVLLWVLGNFKMPYLDFMRR